MRSPARKGTFAPTYVYSIPAPPRWLHRRSDNFLSSGITFPLFVNEDNLFLSVLSRTNWSPSKSAWLNLCSIFLCSSSMPAARLYSSLKSGSSFPSRSKLHDNFSDRRPLPPCKRYWRGDKFLDKIADVLDLIIFLVRADVDGPVVDCLPRRVHDRDKGAGYIPAVDKGTPRVPSLIMRISPPRRSPGGCLPQGRCAAWASGRRPSSF